MLMLSCLHDPCINCAAINYVENCPKNSLVLFFLIFSTTHAQSVAKRPNWIPPASFSCKKSIEASNPCSKPETAGKSKEKSFSTIAASPKSADKFPTPTNLHSTNPNPHTRTPNSHIRTQLNTRTNPKKSKLNTHSHHLISLFHQFLPFRPLPMRWIAETCLSCVANIQKTNFHTSVSLATVPFVQNARFMDLIVSMKSRPHEEPSPWSRNVWGRPIKISPWKLVTWTIRKTNPESISLHWQSQTNVTKTCWRSNLHDWEQCWLRRKTSSFEPSATTIKGIANRPDTTQTWWKNWSKATP